MKRANRGKTVNRPRHCELFAESSVSDVRCSGFSPRDVKLAKVDRTKVWPRAVAFAVLDE